jgi:hypothetical protein
MWMDPNVFTTCGAVMQHPNSGPAAPEHLVATVRVRNHTTGIVIAQGDITITQITIVPPQENA